MRQLFVGSLAFEFQDTALGADGQQAAGPQFSGFFDQPIHALIGCDAAPQIDTQAQLSRGVCFVTDPNSHITSAHAQNGGCVFAAFSIEERDGIVRLHSSNLNMPGCSGRQVQLVA